MSDREMLEFAAKAAGMNVSWDHYDPDYCAGAEGMFLNGERSPDNSKYWNPLEDDGDYSRLEAALGLNVLWGSRTVSVGRKHFGPFEERYQDHNGDRQRARRRAGVCAAAHIVQHIPEEDIVVYYSA